MTTILKKSESPATAVKRAVAAREQCAPSQLGTLAYAIDIDRLNQLVTGSQSGDVESTEPISFSYCGHEIRVEPSGTIHIDN